MLGGEISNFFHLLHLFVWRVAFAGTMPPETDSTKMI